jgi:hypothetical protein
VVHLTEAGPGVSDNRRAYLGEPSQLTRGSGAVDHIAFRCTGLAGVLERLRAEGASFTQRMVSDQGLYQLFLFDPNGVKIELNFSNDEAVALGIRPELKASDLPA